MPNLNSATDIADTLSAPLGELIAAVGRGVAEAQQALDEGTLATFKKIYGTRNRSLLAELGYQPTWYKIPEVNAEISVSLSISSESQSTVSGAAPAAEAGGSRIKLYAVPVDANYSNRYDYDFNAASVIRFKIVPVPPTPQTANLKVVPDLKDITYGQAKALLNSLEIPFKIATLESTTPADNTLLRGSLPEGGEILPPGRFVELILVS